MALSSSRGFAQWAYGIGRLHRARHGKMDIRRGSSVQSDGIALTMSFVFGERHLRHLLNSYQKYYNEARTHLSLHKDAPIPRAVQTIGRALAVPVLGGLHHQYFRA